MDMEIFFPGNKKVSANYRGFRIDTDQPVGAGGDGSAPAPFDLFLASIGTCAGIYVLQFLQQRGLPTEGAESGAEHGARPGDTPHREDHDGHKAGRRLSGEIQGSGDPSGRIVRRETPSAPTTRVRDIDEYRLTRVMRSAPAPLDEIGAILTPGQTHESVLVFGVSEADHLDNDL